MLFLLMLINLIVARNNTAYHPRMIVKKYIKINNKVVAKIFISQSDPGGTRAKNLKTNRNKMLYAGIVFYFAYVIVQIFSATLLFISNGHNIYTPILLNMTFLSFASSFNFFNTVDCAVERSWGAKRLVKWIYMFFGCATALLFLLCVVEIVRQIAI